MESLQKFSENKKKPQNSNPNAKHFEKPLMAGNEENTLSYPAHAEILCSNVKIIKA